MFLITVSTLDLLTLYSGTTVKETKLNKAYKYSDPLLPAFSRGKCIFLTIMRLIKKKNGGAYYR